MGFSDKISRALRKPIRDLNRSFNNQIRNQSRFITREYNNAIGPINDEINLLSEEIDPLVDDISQMNANINDMTDYLNGIPQDFDNLYNRIEENVKTDFENVISPVLTDLDSAIVVIDNIKTNVGEFPGLLQGFYRMIQRILQNILDQLALLNPATAWDEVKGSLKIIIPIILAILIFIQALPTIVANILF